MAAMSSRTAAPRSRLTCVLTCTAEPEPMWPASCACAVTVLRATPSSPSTRSPTKSSLLRLGCDSVDADADRGIGRPHFGGRWEQASAMEVCRALAREAGEGLPLRWRAVALGAAHMRTVPLHGRSRQAVALGDGDVADAGGHVGGDFRQMSDPGRWCTDAACGRNSTSDGAPAAARYFRAGDFDCGPCPNAGNLLKERARARLTAATQRVRSKNRPSGNRAGNGCPRRGLKAGAMDSWRWYRIG